MTGFLTSLFASPEKRAHPATDPNWLNVGRKLATASGVDVTPDGALTYTAVWACVRILSESVAMLPLVLYERTGRSKQRATNHPLYTVLHDVANPEMTSFELRETLMGHLATWGNGYGYIVWGNDGHPRELWPLRPDRMRVARENGRLQYYYRIRAGSPEIPLSAEAVLHLRGLGGDGVVGYSPIYMHRESIGLGKAAEEFGARFFGNDARPGGILEHPGVLGDDAYKRVKTNWVSEHGGLDKSHRVAILEEGMKFHEVGIPPEDAQFLETRKFQVQDVARIYRMPPHKLADLDRATFSNIEHLSIEFVTDTLMPWLVRWEKRVSLQLLTPPERTRFFAEHLVDGLLRGDIKSRYEAYAIGRQNGFLSADDIREKENMNELPDGTGQVYLVPLNMIPADQVGQFGAAASTDNGRFLSSPHETRAQRADRSAQMRYRLQQAHRPLFADVAGRILRREANDVGNAIQKFIPRGDVAGLNAWLLDFYQEHEQFVARQMLPVARTYGDLVVADVADETTTAVDQASIDRMVNSYISNYAIKHVGNSQARLNDILTGQGRATRQTPDELLGELEGELDTWRDVRPDEEGLEESVREGNYLAKSVYILAGIQFLRWYSVGKTCPYCTNLNGRTVGITKWFLSVGEEFAPAGAAPLKISKNMGHPPAHRGCDCLVVGG